MREESSFLTGRFLHKTLMLFHLYGFLVIMLSFEMVSYNVFVPLLLRLSNDVEENPSTTIFEIMNSNNTVYAEFSQGSQSKFGDNAGKQFVAMSLTAIIFKYIKHFCNWNSSNLNNILFHGNCLYGCIKGSVNKDFLLLTDVPSMVSINDKTYALTYRESLTGELFMTCHAGPYVCLKNAFTNLFFGLETNYECCLLTIDCNSVAVFKMSDNTSKIFDSHSRDLYGMPCFSGRCVLLTVESLENLKLFFQIISPLKSWIPFEIKGVSVTLASIDNNNKNNQSVNDQKLPSN